MRRVAIGRHDIVVKPDQIIQRIDHLLVSAGVAERIVWAEIDREARKGKPTPSDHAPVIISIDARGIALDAGWAGADERIAARRAGRAR